MRPQSCTPGKFFTRKDSCGGGFVCAFGIHQVACESLEGEREEQRRTKISTNQDPYPSAEDRSARSVPRDSLTKVTVFFWSK